MHTVGIENHKYIVTVAIEVGSQPYRPGRICAARRQNGCRTCTSGDAMGESLLTEHILIMSFVE